MCAGVWCVCARACAGINEGTGAPRIVLSSATFCDSGTCSLSVLSSQGHSPPVAVEHLRCGPCDCGAEVELHLLFL